MTFGTPVIKPVSTIHLSLKSSCELPPEFRPPVNASLRKVLKPSPHTPIQGLLENTTPHRHGPFTRVHRGRESTEMIFGPSFGPPRRRSFGVSATHSPYHGALFNSDLRAERCPSICSLADGVAPVRRVSTLISRGSPEVDPMMPTGVDPMLSPGVPLKPTVILMLRSWTLQVPEMYETNALTSLWGLSQDQALAVSDAILRTQSREFRRRAPVSLSEDLPEILSEISFGASFGHPRRQS
uniref:Uncharacterized protein n=1 Tax=Tanacetum cinerariifolium TaxID=118510 RepID=A0A6L2P1Q1_TANCI|nr:hypothetical protein [Tanacetum cinerariifolium]